MGNIIDINKNKKTKTPEQLAETWKIWLGLDAEIKKYCRRRWPWMADDISAAAMEMFVERFDAVSRDGKCQRSQAKNLAYNCAKKAARTHARANSIKCSDNSDERLYHVSLNQLCEQTGHDVIDDYDADEQVQRAEAADQTLERIKRLGVPDNFLVALGLVAKGYSQAAAAKLIGMGYNSFNKRLNCVKIAIDRGMSADECTALYLVKKGKVRRKSTRKLPQQLAFGF
jgi:hypothetical protein